MFSNQIKAGNEGVHEMAALDDNDAIGEFGDCLLTARSGTSLDGEGIGEMASSRTVQTSHGGYERELIQSVWEFAEVVSGIDAALWRKDEYGDWIYRFDYGRRTSEFGWEIFDPGVGRHTQGVYAMRPMQWQSFIRQYEAFA